MLKKILILLTVACFATQSTGTAYALRPVSSNLESEFYAPFKNSSVKNRDSQFKAFEEWLRSLKREDLTNAIYSLRILDKIISGLNDYNPHVIIRAGEIIKSLNDAGMLDKDSLKKHIPVEKLAANL